jgi:hypothetical protein
MAAAAVQTSSVAAGTGTTVSATLSATVKNNLVVIHIVMATTAETCSSVTDNASPPNTYVLSSPVDNTTRTYQAYGVQITGGATSFTATFSSNVVTKGVGADEYSGTAVSNAAVFNTSGTGTGSATTCAVTGFSPTQAGLLCVATIVLGSVRVFTAGTNYTRFLNGSNSANLHSEYRLVGTTSETAPGSWTTSTTYGEIASSFWLTPLKVDSRSNSRLNSNRRSSYW